MKTITFPLSLGLVFLAFYGCGPIELTMDEPIVIEQAVPETSVCMSYSGPYNTLPLSLVRDMIQNYTDNQLESTKSLGFEFEDARAIWFDLETLKEFIYQIETLAKETDNTIHNDQLGVHIYYGSYPTQNQWVNKQYNRSLSRVPNNYEKKHTVVIVPTLEIGGDNIDINVLDQSTYGNGMRGVDNYQNLTFNTPMLGLSVLQEDETSAQNHGSLFPPGDTSNLYFIRQ